MVLQKKNNFGDHKKIDSEISELRLKFGSGYRIYYTEVDNVIVLLINGGDKSTQSKDIEKAKNTVSGFAKKVGMSRAHLYSLFKSEKEPKFSTIIKIFQELGYELEVA